jgi:hypothetical protein
LTNKRHTKYNAENISKKTLYQNLFRMPIAISKVLNSRKILVLSTKSHKKQHLRNIGWLNSQFYT